MLSVTTGSSPGIQNFSKWVSIDGNIIIFHEFLLGYLSSNCRSVHFVYRLWQSVSHPLFSEFYRHSSSGLNTQ